MRVRRRLLATTSSELADMPMAAIHGATQPAAAAREVVAEGGEFGAHQLAKRATDGLERSTPPGEKSTRHDYTGRPIIPRRRG